jgi:hypothetical protein
MSENPHSQEDWRQVNKGRRAVTHTDERRVTPVRNQLQELSEYQEDSLAPRKLIVEFTGLQTEEGILPTDPSDSGHNDNNSNDDENTDIPEDDNTDIPDNDKTNTGPIRSTESFDTTTNITSDYASLLETIRLVSVEQATIFSGKKKN